MSQQELVQSAIEKLRATPGVRGALLATRDGFLVLSHWPGLHRPETFAAMTATLMGAAEAALDGAAPPPLRVSIEAAGARFLIFEVDAELLLAVATEPSSDAATVVDAARGLAATLGGPTRGG